MNKKFIRVLGLGVGLFLAGSLSVNAQKVSFNGERLSLKQAFEKIESVSKYKIAYNTSQLDVNKQVVLNQKNQDVLQILSDLLKGTNCVYQVNDNYIVITLKDDEKVKKIKGTIKDSAGEPIIGANVILKGDATVGSITDIDGNFDLSVPSNATLQVSYIGYNTQDVPVGNKSFLNITLKEDTETLDEVVVVGFGTQKKVNLTGAVASVSSEALANKPVANIGQALQGVLPNLNVSATSASPGAVPSFNVRGGTSMSQDSNGKWQVDEGSPLILVDGIQMDATYLNMLNPNDIESISLLKDAASAAIYGARATYGVMLVTTKSGQKEQRPTVTYNFSMQWNTPSHRPDIMDAYTLQLAENERTEWTGNSVSDWSMQLLEAKKKWMENPTAENAWIYQQGSTSKFSWVSSMNPFEEVVRDWTPLQKHTASISGGTAKSRYYLSLGYQHQEGMYKINTDKQNRFNGLMSIDSEITKWFKVNAKISYNVSNLDEPYINPQKGSLWSAMMGEPERNVCAPVKTAATDPLGEMWTDNIIGWLAYGATKETKRTNAVFSINPTIT